MSRDPKYLEDMIEQDPVDIRKKRVATDMKKPKVNKQTKAKLETKIQGDMQMLYTDPINSPLYCDQCKTFMGLAYCMKKALFKKKGSEYIIKCKDCNHNNIRIKGQLKKDLKKRW